MINYKLSSCCNIYECDVIAGLAFPTQWECRILFIKTSRVLMKIHFFCFFQNYFLFCCVFGSLHLWHEIFYRQWRIFIKFTLVVFKVRINYLSEHRNSRRKSLLLQIMLAFHQAINIYFLITQAYRCTRALSILISLASETFNGPFMWMRSVLSWNRDVPYDRHYLFTSSSEQFQVESHGEGEREKKRRPATEVWRREKGPFVCRIVHIYRS